MKIKLISITLILITTVSCLKNNIFFQYHTLSESGWNKDSVFTFDIPINDVNLTYNVYINIRNTTKYTHQNMWLFLEEITPDNKSTTDTIEFYLADNRGKWLGSGIGSIFEMPVLYKQNFKFKTKGNYRYSIKHGMRDTVLIGIKDLGFKVDKSN